MNVALDGNGLGLVELLFYSQLFLKLGLRPIEGFINFTIKKMFSKPEPLADLFSATGLQSVEARALDAPTAFADFDDYWSPFLGGQGPAGRYCVSLSEDDREHLRERLKNTVPVSAGGTIQLIARAWVVRGTVPA